jgi:hypothetical protein
MIPTRSHSPISQSHADDVIAWREYDKARQDFIAAVAQAKRDEATTHVAADKRVEDNTVTIAGNVDSDVDDDSFSSETVSEQSPSEAVAAVDAAEPRAASPVVIPPLPERSRTAHALKRALELGLLGERTNHARTI